MKRLRLARNKARAQEAEAEIERLRAELDRAEREIEKQDEANAELRRDLATSRRTLLCVALLAEEDRVVNRWISDARNATKTIHQVA